MSRRPPNVSPIPDFLAAENEEQAREAIGAASQEELDALRADFDAIDLTEINSDIDALQSDVAGIHNSINSINGEINQTIPAQNLMGNPGGSPVKPAPVDLDDGGLIITGGKIQVGDTYGKVLYFDSSRSDGKTGKGTLSSPLNASTPARIDAIMTPLYNAKAAVNIMLLPTADYRFNPVNIMDVYPVNPTNYAPWYVWDRLYIKGFGKARTVIKPAAGIHPGVAGKCRFSIFRSSFKPEDGEFVFNGGIEDLTMDGEITSNNPPGPDSVIYTWAYDVAGYNVAIKNVHFRQFGGKGQEMFPVSLRNGFKSGSTIYIPERSCNFLIENCSADLMYQNGAGIGFLMNGSLERASNIRQRGVFTKNDLEDCYLCWGDFNNLEALYNRMRIKDAAGLGIYASFNCDTGINRGVKIIGNDCSGVIGNGVATGCVTLGNWLSDHLQVMVSDILIKENTFEMYPNSQALYNPGVVMVGNVHNWNISDNFYYRRYTSSPFSKRGFASAKGTGNAANPTGDGTGWGTPWNVTRPFSEGGPPEDGSAPWARIPGGGPQQGNSPGIMFNNKLIERDGSGNYTVDHGKTPDGMANELMSVIV